MNKYTYKKSDGEDIWTVGHDKDGEWIPESDWESEDDARQRAAFLNYPPRYYYTVGLLNDLRKRIEEMRESYRNTGLPGNSYNRGAADACGLILDLAELRLFLPAKDGGE